MNTAIDYKKIVIWRALGTVAFHQHKVAAARNIAARGRHKAMSIGKMACQMHIPGFPNSDMLVGIFLVVSWES